MLRRRLPFPGLDARKLRLRIIFDKFFTHLLSYVISQNDLFLFCRVYGELREPFGI